MQILLGIRNMTRCQITFIGLYHPRGFYSWNPYEYQSLWIIESTGLGCVLRPGQTMHLVSSYLTKPPGWKWKMLLATSRITFHLHPFKSNLDSISGLFHCSFSLLRRTCFFQQKSFSKVTAESRTLCGIMFPIRSSS